MDKIKEIKECLRKKLAVLSEMNVEDDWKSVAQAVLHVKKYGSPLDIEKVKILKWQWCWFNCQEWMHSDEKK